METDSGLDSPPYQLRLLGTPRIEGPEGVLTGSIAQRHRIALLALLATAPRGGLARDRLLGLLWPEAPTESARNLLNAAVHAVRRSLGEDVLISQGNGICLDASRVSIDVLEFEAALKAGKPGHAVDLYSGPFLDGLALPGAVEFEHWQEVERDRLERLFHTALERQAETIARAHGPVEAVTWWRRRLACTPTDARVVIRLMEALAASGDRAGALQAASVHAALMETEFGTSPDPDVLSLTEQLRAAPVIPRRSEPATPPAAEPASGALPAQPRSPRPRLTFAASAIVLLVTVGALLTALLDRAPILEPDRVIVAVFENQTGDPSLEPLGRIAADWITDGLQRSGMKVVPSLNALRAWRYVQGELGAARADDPVRALAEETGSALVVSGSYYRDRVGLHFRGQVSDAMADRLMISPVLVSTSADTMAAIDLLAQRITGGLALALELGPRLGTNASAMQPPKYAAFLEVVQGWDRFISTDSREHWSTFTAPQLSTQRTCSRS